MVDRLRVERLLRKMANDLAVLDTEAKADPDRRDDPIWLRGVKYSFVTVIEAAIDLAQHLCATSGWGPPSDNGDALRLLGEHDVLATDLADSMRRAVGFRNVLVHDYADVDDGVVLARLRDLSELRAFVTAIAVHLDEVDPPG